MIKDELIDLFCVFSKQQSVNEDLIILKKETKENKIQMDIIKKNLIASMVESDIKFCKYKNLEITLVENDVKVKLKKEELSSTIEGVISKSDLTVNEKSLIILDLIKPQKTGEKKLSLKIKNTKKDSYEYDSD